MMTREDQSAARAAKRCAFAEALADIALRDGLEALSLRPAAVRLGTSDRMLLYYFGTKSELVAETLRVVSGRLASKLAVVPVSACLTPIQMVKVAAGLLTDQGVRPFMALWTEIVARAVRGESIYRDVAARTAAGWIEWIATRTSFPPNIEAEIGASAMLSVIEALSSRSLMRDVPDTGAGLETLQILLTD